MSPELTNPRIAKKSQSFAKKSLSFAKENQPGASAPPATRVIAAALLSIVTVVTAATAQPRVDPSPELERLHFQLGSWTTTTRSLDKEGEVVSTRTGRAEISLAHRGLLIHALHYPAGGDEPVWRIWQYHGRYDGILHDVTFDMVGHFEHRTEVDNEGRLAFEFPEMRSFQDGVPRNWRKTYRDVTEGSFVTTWDYTTDGSTWTPIFHTTYERRPTAEAAPPGPPDGPLAGLEPWIGTWESRLDPKYADHPMIKRFNPELKGHELILAWGLNRETVYVKSWQLDRPEEGDRTLAMEGMLLRNPADGSMAMVEYGGEQGIFHRGHYELQPNGDLHRVFDAFFPSADTRRYREVWRWSGPDKQAFQWITQSREGDEWVAGDIVIDYYRKQP